MPVKKKSHEAISTSLNDLLRLINEMEKNKEIVQKLIQQSPNDLKNHRVYCAYTGKINDLFKLKIQTEKIDPLRLLSEALRTVAVFLAENKEISAAHCIGDNVEEIEEKVIQQWWDYQETETKIRNGRQEKGLKKVSDLSIKGVQIKKKATKKKH